MQPLVPLVFHNLPSLYPPSLICYTAFWLCQCTIYNIGARRRFALYMQLSFPSSLFAITVDIIIFVMQHTGIELGPHRYDDTLLTSTLCYTRMCLPLVPTRILHLGLCASTGLKLLPHKSLVIRIWSLNNCLTPQLIFCVALNLTAPFMIAYLMVMPTTS